MRVILPLLLSMVLLAGCAEPRKSMTITPAIDGRGSAPVWPKGEDVPRYVYVGELTGEDNFEGSGDSGVNELFALLVGLGQTLQEPVILKRPQGITEDVQGNVWVTDVSRQAVFLFDHQNGELKLFSEAAAGTAFVAPIGIAAMPGGNVLVADAELGYVVELGPNGEFVRSIGQEELTRPTGVAVSPSNGRIYVADTKKHVVRVFDASGSLLFSFGDTGPAGERMNAPTYLALDREGRVLVTDTLNARVQMFSADGAYLSQIGERGLYVGNLARPKGVSVSEEGLVYVVESFYDHLLVFDDEGRFMLPIGGTGYGPGQFYLPGGVWAGRNGRVYVADMFNGRVSIFQFLGGTL